jgi:hypothetical protein
VWHSRPNDGSPRTDDNREPPLKGRDARTLFSEFQEHANIVVLGDPGAGKSHLFRYFAEREVGKFLTVRSFLNVPTVTAAGPLFVDALDERRSGRSDHATIDALVQKLFSANPAKVRISCRAQDWLGETDLATLRDCFDVNGGYVVLGLDELAVEDRVDLAHRLAPAPFASHLPLRQSLAVEIVRATIGRRTGEPGDPRDDRKPAPSGRPHLAGREQSPAALIELRANPSPNDTEWRPRRPCDRPTSVRADRESQQPESHGRTPTERNSVIVLDVLSSMVQACTDRHRFQNTHRIRFPAYDAQQEAHLESCR